jgi:hypothetical protein
MRDAVLEHQLAVAGQTIRDQRQSLVTLGVGGTFEKFIQHAGDDIRGGQNITRHPDLVRRFPVEQVIPVRIIDRHLQP